MSEPIVMTGSGGVRGVRRGDPGDADSSAAFLGIPFAAAPVGERRFAAPAPPEPWDGIRDATRYGATPLRIDTPDSLIPEPAVPGESTLNVNVFTPAPGDARARLPVLVWIHGGGYVAGSPASPWYDGRAFTRDGVVTVTISYRLGFEGFGHIEDAPSNRGVRDWVAALEWVQRNIAVFGGDPGRVTIGGQSAGGGAVLTLLGMPATHHLFQRALALSGILSDVALPDAVARSARLAVRAGVPPTAEGFGRVEEKRLVELQSKAGPSRKGLGMVRELLAKGVPWAPVVDGDLLPRATIDALRSGAGADKPLLIGATTDEFTMTTDSLRGRLRFVPAALGLRLLGADAGIRRSWLAAHTPHRGRGTAALLGRYVSDRVFSSVVSRAANARSGAPASTWTYRFDWVSPAKGWSCHCLDVPFWFDCLGEEHVAALAGENPPQPLADQMHAAAAAFIRTGDPGWAAYLPDAPISRIFDGDGSPTTANAYAAAGLLR